jgi:pantetheine-phosphate adenylyltransferase
MSVKAIYPGSFDPPTSGHIDLIERGSHICDHLYVAVLRNRQKEPLFTVEERVEMLIECTKDYPNVEVVSFGGLMVDYARKLGVSAILRGIRAISDYEYEFQMALMNRRLAPELETVFLQPSEKYSFVSSRLVKDVYGYGGAIQGLVPDLVYERLKQRVKSGE